MVRKVLTDELVAKQGRRREGGRYEVMDKDVPGLALRIGKKKNFILICRLPNKDHPSRLTIGTHPEMTIDQARDVARQWIAYIRQGLDPRAAVKRLADHEEMQSRQTFHSLLVDYMAVLPLRERNRSVPKDIKLFKRNLLNAQYNEFLDLPASELTDGHISTVIKAIRDRPSRIEAIQCFKHLRMCFRWGRSPERREHYGIKVNPVTDLTLSNLQLFQRSRTRHLVPREIRALLRAIDKIGYPFGSYCYMLLLTGQRKEEVAAVTWDEIDFQEDLWTIPESRYKTGTEQLVPLSRQVRELLLDIRGSLPAEHGPYVFSFTNGVTRINGFSRSVRQLRAQVQIEFIVENPGLTMAHWTLHDMRRTVKTRLGALQVDPHVSEAVLGHGKRGIEKVYDQYRYLPQTDAALQKWADFLSYLASCDQVSGIGYDRSSRSESRPNVTQGRAIARLNHTSGRGV